MRRGSILTERLIANDEWVFTCTIITGEPNEFVREIHTQMPVILPDVGGRIKTSH
jgi:putative SOS response-associated peptidase YedK